MEKKLEVKDLKISFRTQDGKVQAVRDINFDLYKGETLAIVGESGSGKSVTNRAIIGILAGNAIVEGGEILYDGQDLLKISEEDFHKLRGDKIAMIFQDPMSSLNPIMRVGKQLTEAMLLKGKASQRGARRAFNGKLALLNKMMDEAFPAAAAENKELCKTFDNFCINATRMEAVYNAAAEKATELESDIGNLLFLAEKKQDMDGKAKLHALLRDIPGVYNPFVVHEGDSELSALTAQLQTAAAAMSGKHAKFDDETVAALGKIRAILTAALATEKPNFFCLGYYTMRNPEFDVRSMPVAELNAMVRKYIDDEFMLNFIEKAKAAYTVSFQKALAGKKEAVRLIADADAYFAGEINEKAAGEWFSKLRAAVESGIDPLTVRKDSMAYTFASSMRSALSAYFGGVRRNPKEQARYDKQTAKRNALIEKGKAPDWKVVPPSLVDLDNAKNNIRHVLARMSENYGGVIASAESYNAENAAIELIDYLKEQASAVVYKVTRRLAKVRALKLLEEVGIPNPEIRYRQYPFEFSGGMRQRIVIAIALAANPDILICDEPTTALDVTIQAQILELINRIKAERHLSVIFITHNLGVVANMADRIAVMYAGKIVEYGTSDDIFYDPKHPYTWALLSSMPDLDTKEKLEAIPGTPPSTIFPPKGDAFAARNKYALAIDFEQQPPLFKVSDTHYAATWLLHPDAPKVEPPKIMTDRIARMAKKEAETHHE